MPSRIEVHVLTKAVTVIELTEAEIMEAQARAAEESAKPKVKTLEERVAALEAKMQSTGA